MGKKNEDKSLKGEFPCVLSLKHKRAVFPMAQQRVGLAKKLPVSQWKYRTV